MSFRGSKVLFVAFAMAVYAACSGDGSSSAQPTAGGGGGGGGGSSSSSYVCCLNSVVYGCPDKAAFDKCTGFDMEGCQSKCTISDMDCMSACFDQASSAKHDPSSCTQNSSLACPGSSGGGGGGGSGGGGGGGGSCSGTGSPCDISSDCCSGKCTPRKDGMKGNSCEF